MVRVDRNGIKENRLTAVFKLIYGLQIEQERDQSQFLQSINFMVEFDFF